MNTITSYDELVKPNDILILLLEKKNGFIYIIQTMLKLRKHVRNKKKEEEKRMEYGIIWWKCNFGMLNAFYNYKKRKK